MLTGCIVSHFGQDPLPCSGLVQSYSHVVSASSSAMHAEASVGSWEVLDARPFVDNGRSKSALARGLYIPGWSWRRLALGDYVLLQRRPGWLSQAAEAMHLKSP